MSSIRARGVHRPKPWFRTARRAKRGSLYAAADHRAGRAQQALQGLGDQ
jgi:hypothetical protein